MLCSFTTRYLVDKILIPRDVFRKFFFIGLYTPIYIYKVYEVHHRSAINNCLTQPIHAYLYKQTYIQSSCLTSHPWGVNCHQLGVFLLCCEAHVLNPLFP